MQTTFPVCCHHNAGTNEASTVLVNKLLTIPSVTIGASIENGIVRTLADTIQTVYSLKSKMVDDLVEHLISPLQKFLREDIRKVKETGRNFEKTMEKFDAALIKYCSLSKLKEPSALKEDEFQLFEIRKSYVKGLNRPNIQRFVGLYI